jgi:flagellar biosynthesis component FlhA
VLPLVLCLLCVLQLLPSKRFSHVKALMQQLAAWAADEQQQQPNQSTTSSSAAAQQQQQQQLSRVQQLMQLPLDSEEEAALLGWFRQRMESGQSGGHVLPLYLLQVRGQLL